MGFRIATNVQALTAQRTLGENHEVQNHELEKLSSGTRIVRSADDAAGMAISEKLKAEIRSVGQASRNAQDGISFIQVAEGGMTEIGNILIRLRELSIQAASDTVGANERKFIDKEVQSLKEESNRIAQSTQFNGTKLLNGQGNDLEFQVGTGPSPELDRIKYKTQETNVTLDKLGVTSVSNMTKEDAQDALAKLDNGINMLSENRSALGALQNRLGSTINNLAVRGENMSAANSRIRDADFAVETSELTKRNILTQAGTATLAQANNNTSLALRLVS